MRDASDGNAASPSRAGRRGLRRLAVALLVLALPAVLPAVAGASAGLSVTSEFPASASIGATAVAGSLTVTNTSSQDEGSVTVCRAGDSGQCLNNPGVTLVPSCRLTDFTGCSPTSGDDPGVFAIGSTALGDPASACSGVQFVVAQIDAVNGRVSFNPIGGNIVLAAGSTCRINFTFGVQRSPASDAGPLAGRQTLQVVEAAGVSGLNHAAFGRGFGGLTVTPGPPTLTGTDPASPANQNLPEIIGTAPAGITSISLYTNATCTGTPIATGTVAAFISGGLTITVADDAVTTIYAAGTDADLGTTPCSANPITYTEDSTPPPVPTVSDVDPDSPANDNVPRVKGSATAGTVKLYTDATCTSAVAGSGSAAAFASPGLTVAVADNTTTTFHATATDAAGNASACSATSVTYTEDSTPPGAPSATATDPASPSGVGTPRVIGSAPAGATTVRIYTTASCTQPAAGQGSAATFASPGIEVSVPANATTTFYATAVDAAGNASACTPTGLTYVEDSTAPPAPQLSSSDPASPSGDNTPRLEGTAEAGSTVRIYTDAACASGVVAEGSAAAFAAPGLEVTVPDNFSATYHARALDAAGNASACSGGLSYREDSILPAIVVGDGPAGNPPTFTFSSPEAGSSFECRLDSGAFVPCTSPYRPTGLAAGNHTFEVRAIDAAGNVGAASAPRSFTVATPPPAIKTPTQTGCVGITGRLYVGTAARNIRNGASAIDIMFGQAGNDVLRGGAGADCLYGGVGADLLRGGSGADRLFGGSGNDRVEGLSGNDRVNGESGNDRLVGGAGNDTIAGAAGLDRLLDRSGRDRLSGGAGHDRIDARDSTPVGRRRIDRITCGPGRDTVLADPKDIVANDCERVTKRSIGVAAARTY